MTVLGIGCCCNLSHRSKANGLLPNELSGIPLIGGDQYPHCYEVATRCRQPVVRCFVKQLAAVGPLFCNGHPNAIKPVFRGIPNLGPKAHPQVFQGAVV